MKLSIPMLLYVFVVLCAGNFAAKYLTNHDYLTALERSYFQAYALFCVWLFQKFVKA